MPVQKSRSGPSPQRRRAMRALLLAGPILILSGQRPASAGETSAGDIADYTILAPIFEEPAPIPWDKVEQAGAITLDAALLRPAGALALVVGCVFFVASAPLVAPFEGIQGSLDTFVRPQYDYTFLRELGDF